MKLYSVLFAAAAFGATALSVGMAVAPAHAARAAVEEVVVTGRTSDLPSAIVRYDDLNLASAGGRERLDRRVATAARMLCGRPVLYLSMNAKIEACHDAVETSAAPQIEALLAAANSGTQVALGGVRGLTVSAK
jgi:UrcA family protein